MVTKIKIGLIFVSTHSRPKAAGGATRAGVPTIFVSTHSRPKAAGKPDPDPKPNPDGFNTQPPEGGWLIFSRV